MLQKNDPERMTDTQFEAWLAPLIEFLGFLYLIFLVVFSDLNWWVYLIFFMVVYSFAILFSITSLFFEEFSFQQYKKPKYILRLLGTILLEPLFYHPFIMWASVKGNWDLINGKKSWGAMSRTGLRRKEKN